MAKIFFEFSGGLGPLIRCLPIANYLRELGHDIIYFGHPECRYYMNELKYQHIELDVVKLVDSDIEVKSNWINADEFWASSGFSNKVFLKREIDVWINKIKEYNPDVIISDLGVFSSLVARILGIPIATITQSCYHTRAAYKPQRYWENQSKLCTKSLDAINYVLDSYGAPLLNCFEEIFVGNITIIPSFPEFDKLIDKELIDDRTYYVGPILWEGLTKKDKMEYKSVNNPHVFCYGGSIVDYKGNGGQKFFELIIDVFKDNDIEAIISTGSIVTSTKLAKRYNYERIKIVDWIPIKEAYTNSNLVICHGGHGSCMGLFKYMVPGIILSTHTEREYNARLLEELGAGISIPYENFSKKEMEHAITTILGNESYMNKIKYYNELISTRYQNGEVLAANYILSLCK